MLDANRVQPMVYAMGVAYVQQWTFYGWYDDDNDFVHLYYMKTVSCNFASL